MSIFVYKCITTLTSLGDLCVIYTCLYNFTTSSIFRFLTLLFQHNLCFVFLFANHFEIIMKSGITYTFNNLGTAPIVVMAGKNRPPLQIKVFTQNLVPVVVFKFSVILNHFNLDFIDISKIHCISVREPLCVSVDFGLIINLCRILTFNLLQVHIAGEDQQWCKDYFRGK